MIIKKYGSGYYVSRSARINQNKPKSQSVFMLKNDWDMTIHCRVPEELRGKWIRIKIEEVER